MAILWIILKVLALASLIGYIWFIEYRFFLMKKAFRDHHRKLNLSDKDIRTLHSNQKLLHSSIKQLHKDLRIYGEVKKSKIKSFSQIEAGEKGTGTI